MSVAVKPKETDGVFVCMQGGEMANQHEIQAKNHNDSKDATTTEGVTSK